MGQGPFECIAGEDTNVQFVLYTADGNALQASATIASGDVKYVNNLGAATNVTNLPTNEGVGVYNIVVDAADFTTFGVKGTIILDDATTPETFLGTSLDLVFPSKAEIAQKYYAGPYGPGVYVDGSGTAGSVLGVNGTPSSPTTTWASALTLAGKLGINRFYVMGATNLTLSGNSDEYELIAIGRGSFNAGSQRAIDTVFRDCGVTGTFTSGLCDIIAHKCFFDSITNLLSSTGIYDTILSGTFVMAAGTTTFKDCAMDSVVTAVVIDLATNDSNVAFSDFTGDILLKNMDATNTAVIDGTGVVTIDSSCTGGTVIVRGNVTPVDNSGASVTIIELTGVNLTQINGETAPVLTLQRQLSTTIDATITSGGGSTTSWRSTGIPTSNDGQLIDRTGVFVTGPAAGRGFVVTAYTDSVKEVQVDKLNVAPADGDRFLIFA